MVGGGLPIYKTLEYGIRCTASISQVSDFSDIWSVPKKILNTAVTSRSQTTLLDMTVTTMAFPNTWLSLHRQICAPDVWVLTERPPVYNTLVECRENQNLVILVRGRQKTPGRRVQDGIISFLPFPSNWIVAECTLHEPSAIAYPSSASATAFSLIRYH